MGAGPVLSRPAAACRLGALAAVVVSATRRLQQHPQGDVDVDPPVFQEVRGVSGAMYLLHPDPLLHETRSMPVRTSRCGSGKIPRIFVSMRLHDRLFVKGNWAKACDALIQAQNDNKTA